MAHMEDALTRFLSERAEGVTGPPSPGGFYSKEGDCVFFYNEPVDSKAERVDELLTVYRALDDNRIVGAQIKGISRLPKHDLMRLTVMEYKGIEIVALVLSTFYRQRPDGIERDPRTLRSYAEVLGSLRGSVCLDEALIP
jgi:hypothetical protein